MIVFDEEDLDCLCQAANVALISIFKVGLLPPVPPAPLFKMLWCLTIPKQKRGRECMGVREGNFLIPEIHCVVILPEFQDNSESAVVDLPLHHLTDL